MVHKCNIVFIGHTPKDEVIKIETVYIQYDFEGEDFVEYVQNQLNGFLAVAEIHNINAGNMRINVKEFATLQFFVSRYVDNTIKMEGK